MKHTPSVDRPICELASSVEMIGDATRAIYGGVDCEACLRRAIAEGDERTRVLRELLVKVEAAS